MKTSTRHKGKGLVCDAPCQPPQRREQRTSLQVLNSLYDAEHAASTATAGQRWPFLNDTRYHNGELYNRLHLPCEDDSGYIRCMEDSGEM